MASNLLIMLAASGLVAAAPAVTETRASDAAIKPAAYAVKAPAATAAGTGCFLPTKNGKVASLVDFRKAKAAGACANANPHMGAGGSLFSPKLPIVALVPAGLALGFAINQATQSSNSPK
jgi:hypothetical protein